MKNGKPEWQERRAIISRQEKFIGKLVDVVKTVAKESANRQKKMEKLQLLLKDENKTNFAKFEALPLPLDPEIRITGIVSKE
jgi:phosphatidylinositol 3-kinase